MHVFLFSKIFLTMQADETKVEVTASDWLVE